MFYKILSQPSPTATLMISRKSALADSCQDGSVITLFFGSRSAQVSLHVTDQVKKDVVTVSKEVLNTLSLPHNLTYQLIHANPGLNSDLRIGPVIGLLMFTQKNAMTEKTLRKYLSHALLYNTYKGLLYVFSVDGVNFNTNTVNGFAYNSSKHSWEEGIFPLPDAIYRRVPLSKKIRVQLQETTNNRMYNALYFDKLDFWHMASSREEIAEHLPMTRVYESIHDVDEMLTRYRVLFLKPINSTRALGLIRVKKNGDIYSFQRKTAANPKLFSSQVSASRYIDSVRKGRKYLVQEGIDLLNFDARYLDFRVIMQKDHILAWQCTGIVASIGKPGGVCSNYSMNAIYMPFEKFFKEHFSFANKEVLQKKQEIVALCEKACYILDENGEYADLGIDVGLDTTLKPWIFEINNRRHEHEMPLYAKDYGAYFRSRTNPIRYGVKLSGFDIAP